MKRVNLGLLFIGLFLIVSLSVITSCASTSNTGLNDPRGTWNYTLVETGTGNIYDKGTITLIGDATSGTWTTSNYYQVEYTGTWTLSAGQIQVRGGENWLGTQKSTTLIEGTWSNSDSSGTLKASR